MAASDVGINQAEKPILSGTITEVYEVDRRRGYSGFPISCSASHWHSSTSHSRMSPLVENLKAMHCVGPGITTLPTSLDRNGGFLIFGMVLAWTLFCLTATGA